MAKTKNNKIMNNKNVQQKTDAELAEENGLKQIALRAQRGHNK